MMNKHEKDRLKGTIGNIEDHVDQAYTHIQAAGRQLSSLLDQINAVHAEDEPEPELQGPIKPAEAYAEEEGELKAEAFHAGYLAGQEDAK